MPEQMAAQKIENGWSASVGLVSTLIYSILCIVISSHAEDEHGKLVHDIGTHLPVYIPEDHSVEIK
jgi:hypothetical protein